MCDTLVQHQTEKAAIKKPLTLMNQRLIENLVVIGSIEFARGSF